MKRMMGCRCDRRLRGGFLCGLFIGLGASGVGEAQPAKSEAPPLAVSDTSQSSPQQKLKQELERIRGEFQVPGLWAGKFHVDGRSLMEASGVRRWKSDTEIERDDCIHLGSCTKAMTAVLIGQLYRENKLSPTSTLRELFHEIEGLKDSRWGDVTVNQLLHHESGFPANASWGMLDFQHPGKPVEARRAMLKNLIAVPRSEKTTFLYSNVGYALLGHIVETIENEPWEKVIRRKLFEPLEMTSAGFGPVGLDDSMFAKKEERMAPSSVAWGHTAKPDVVRMLTRLIGGKLTPDYLPIQIDNPPPLGPAGRAYMTIGDWSKFAILFASESGHNRLQVDQESWSKLLTPSETGNYAGGWMLEKRSWADGRVFIHAGSNTTWYCIAFVAPEKGFCLLLASNVFNEESRKACDQAAKYLLSIEVPDP